MEHHSKIKKEVRQYYDDKLARHGVSPAGVDWNSIDSQELRFEQLLKMMPEKDSFSVLDYGCGYGAFADYLAKQSKKASYLGYDLSEKMIEAAGKIVRSSMSCQFEMDLTKLKPCDYVVASGIFNVRQSESDSTWEEYIQTELNKMAQLASKGMAFNMLTSYSDADKKRDYLYYADPREIFDFCKMNLSRKVACLHDYPLYEFTMIVRFDEGRVQAHGKK